MPTAEWVVFNEAIAATLVAAAVVILLCARRRPENALLVTYLLLVATNWAASGLAPSSEAARKISLVAVALDPFYLLAFVSAFPWSERPPWMRALLAALAAGGIACTALVVLAPETMIAHGGLWGRYDRSGFVLLLAILAAGYVGAWLVALAKVARPPTPRLGGQAAWLLAAVGVVVLPRIAVLPRELALPIPLRPEAADPALWYTYGHDVLYFLVALAFVAASAAFLRARAAPPIAWRATRFVGAFALAVGALMLLMGHLAAIGGPRADTALPFGVRWLVFAGLLAYGMVGLDVGLLRRRNDAALAALAGVSFGAVAATLPAWIAGAVGARPAVLAAASAVTAIAAGSVAAAAAWRALARAPGRADETERALELYRARVEAALADGEMDARARLELDRERARLGLSRDAARAVEHLVTRRRARSEMQRGDEPLVGIVVEREIGRGAHSRVYLARRAPRGEPVVLKHVAALDGATARARVAAEARALRRLSHPNVVRLLDVEVSDGRYLLVMEHVDGTPLSEARDLPWQQARVAALVQDLLAALAAAHAEGILHRDVKPANILLTPRGRAVVTDFGIAATSEAPGASSVATIAEGEREAPPLAGTLSYMAPEQARGVTSVASDLYAVALVALELLTGRPARDLRGLAALDALMVVASRDVSLEGAPAEWRPWLARALARDPASRFASAREMLEALPAPLAAHG